jgi:NADH-quinone oxidoreductase subunit J
VVFDIVFWVLAIFTVAAALGVVLLRDVFRAAMSLILLFLVIAGIYLTLSADFLALVQILVYVGAISILLIVGVMLTRDVMHGNPAGRLRVPAIIVGALLLGTLAWTILGTAWNPSLLPPREPTAAFLGQRLFGTGGYLLQVQIVAILLLTAMLGAIVLLREK